MKHIRQVNIRTFGLILVVLITLLIACSSSQDSIKIPLISNYNSTAPEISATSGITPTQISTISVTPTPEPSLTSTFTPTRTMVPTLTPTLSPTLNPWVEEKMVHMSLEQKVGHMLMVGVSGTQAETGACGTIRHFKPGAIIYRDGNVVSPKQLRELSKGLQDCAQSAGLPPLLIAIDHEGQYVNRFESGATIFPSAMAQCTTNDMNLVYKSALTTGGELAYTGVNMVLGPVADVLLDYNNSVISLRAFGGDPQMVSSCVEYAVRGYLESGLIPVLKHFPGHGGVSGDTHQDLAIDPVHENFYNSVYLAPFHVGIQAGATSVMLSHVSFPNITGDQLPSSLSPEMIVQLRNELGFTGLVMTDSMGMGAIKNNFGSVGEASYLAVLAGVDMLLVTSQQSAQSAFNRLLLAAQQGELPQEVIDQAVRRILTQKAAASLQSFSLPQEQVPDWSTNQIIADTTGYQAVSVIKDEAGLIPLPKGEGRILIIGPTDGWGIYPIMEQTLQEHGYSVQKKIYSHPWKGPIPEREYLYEMTQYASRYDLILFLTWDAHLNKLRFGDTWR